MKKLILAIAIFLGASPLWAELMTYQGRLKEADIPVSANRVMLFQFCGAETGGTCSDTLSGPQSFAVQNGLFKATFTVPTADLSQGQWFLQVSVGPDVPGMQILTPRERLTAVPYSVFASSAGYAAGAVRRAGDTMTGQLTLDGSTLTVTGNEFSVGGSTFVVKNGYVGMGTDAPAARLHVVSDNGVVHMASPGSAFTLNLIPQTNATAGINNNGNGPIVLSVANNEYLRVAPDGNIGVSSATPAYRLSVSSGAGEAGTIMAVSTGATNLFWVAGDGAHATRFVGDGSGLTGVTGATDNTKVLKAGDTMTGQLTASSFTATGIGLRGAQLRLADGDGVLISSEAAVGLGAGVRVSTNVYIVGFSSAARYYGDGSGLTGVTAAGAVQKAGDTMTGHLLMAGASTITVAGSSFSVGGSTFAVVNGRVGIGTGSPALALDVQLPAGVHSEGIRVTARSAIRLDLNSNQADSTARNWSLLSNNPRFGDFSIRRSNSMGGDANSSGATAIYLAREGNVGFSDDLPLYRLHVSSGAGEAGTIMAVSTGATNLFWVAGDGAHATRFVGDGSGLTNLPLSGVDGVLAIGQGGTGGTTPSGARTNLGLIIGSDVQGYDADLADLADGELTGTKVGPGVPAANIDFGLMNGGVIVSSLAAASVHEAAFQSPKVNRNGDTMPGHLTISYSSLTVIGDTFESHSLAVGTGTLPNHLYVSTTGAVGLGTVNPQALLHLSGIHPTEILSIVNPSANSAGITLRGISNGWLATVGSDSGGFYYNVPGSSNVGFRFAGVEKASVTAQGAVSAAYFQVNGSTVLALGSTAPRSLFVGADAGKNNTGSTFNTLVGNSAGWGGSGANFNRVTAVGADAGLNLVSGGYNSLFGVGAGYTMNTGGYNTVVGALAGYGDTGGSNNVMVGHRTGYFNSSGSSNTLVGDYAGYGAGGNSFSYNSVFGANAGYGLTSGSRNILIGLDAGKTVTSGSDNLVIGNGQGTSSPGAGNEMNIGGVLFGDLSQKTIGISTRSPQAALDIVSTATAANIYAQIWRDSSGAVVSSVTSQGVFYGNGSGLTGITASDSTKLPLAGGNMSGQLTTASTITVKGGAFSVGGSTFVVNAGRVGINWITPEAALQVSGGAKFLSSPDTSYVLTAGTSGSPYRFFVSSGGAVGMGDFNGVNVDTASVVHILSKLANVNDGTEDVRVGLFVESNTDGTMDPNDLLVSANLEATVEGADSPSLVSPLRLKVRRENTPTGTVDRAMGLFIDDLQNDPGGAINYTYGIFIGDQTSGTQTNEAFALYSADAGARSYFAGNVGIATAAPQARLDVAADSSGANSMGQIWRNSGGTVVSSVSATGVMMASRFVGDGGGLYNIPGVQKTGDTMTGALTISGSSLTIRPAVSDAYSLYISSADGSTPALTVRPGGALYTAGRVGIGSAAPTEALDISGRVLISTRAGGNEVTDGLLSNGSGGMEFYSAGTKYMKVQNGGGYIGIGPSANVYSNTMSPKLQVKGSMSVGFNFNAKFPAADSLIVEGSLGVSTDTPAGLFQVGGGSLTVLGGGKVGVGTRSPDARLTVIEDAVANSQYILHAGTSSSSYQFMVTTGGWVGINTHTPQAPLHLTAATKDEGIVVEHNSSTSEGSYLALLKARGTAYSQNLVQDGDNLGVLAFGGYNAAAGDPFPTAAAIVGRVDGTPTLSTPDMPGRLEFMTAADNTNETVTRMVIKNDGAVGISTGIPQAMLDIRSTGTLAQIWRDSGGVVRASMTASGVLYAQVDAVSSKVSKTGDNMSGNLTINVDPAIYTYDFATTGIQVSTAGSIVTVGIGNGSTFAGVRGMGAVDLQTARTISGQVAQGVFSTLSGGAYNTILGSNTVVAGGRYNIAAGTSAVISGGEGNYAGSMFSTIGGGKGNSANSNYSAVFTGQSNVADEMYSLVGGGYSNTANTSYSVVAGGSGNEAGVSGGDGQGSFIGGGQGNRVNQNYGAIAGGMNNIVGDSAEYGFVGGGYENEANGTHSAVAGGWWNVAGGMDSFIGGGLGNVASGSYSSVVGGSSNTARGDYSFAAGYKSSSTAAGTFTWSDSQGVELLNAVQDQVRFKARGGFVVSGSTNVADPKFTVTGAGDVLLDNDRTLAWGYMPAPYITGNDGSDLLAFGLTGVEKMKLEGSKLTLYNANLVLSTTSADAGIVFQDGSVQKSAAPRVVSIYKPAAEIRTLDGTATPDSHLQFFVGANEKWAFEFNLYVYTTDATGTADMRVGLAGPPATQLRAQYDLYAENGLTVNAGGVMGGYGEQVVNWTGTVPGVGTRAVVKGTIENGATAGTMFITWGQNVSSAVNTTVLKGSYLIAHKLN